MSHHNYICFDIETGGFSHLKNPITEIAMNVYDGETLLNQFEFDTLVNVYDDLKLEEDALQATNITREMIATGITIEEVVEISIAIFEKFTNGSSKFKYKPILVGHNICDFDIPFLEYAFSRSNKNLYNYVHKYKEDTLLWCRRKWNGKSKKFNLGICCQLAGIKLTDAHRAANDTRANAELHKYLIKEDRNIKTTINNELDNSHIRTFQF